MKKVSVVYFLMIISILFVNKSFADYESYSSTINKVYLYDNATDMWGIRIVLNSPGNICDEWYVKMDTDLRDQMFSLALAAKASAAKVTLMRRGDAENLTNEGKTICGVHRIFFN